MVTTNQTCNRCVQKKRNQSITLKIKSQEHKSKEEQKLTTKLRQTFFKR